MRPPGRTRGCGGCRKRLTKGRHDVGKDVLDLITHGQKDDYNYDRNQNQDEGVLHHSLTALRAAYFGLLDRNSPPLRPDLLGSFRVAERGCL